jgi:hypothetical protein
MNMCNQGLLYKWTAHSAAKIGTMSAEGGPTRDSNYTLGVDFLDHDFFIIQKNSHQDLYNEGSNFILSSLEVGH